MSRMSIRSLLAPAPGLVPLPPSVEQAYRGKCVELKRRMKEIEEVNDAYRIRKVRLQRGIMKLRLERAFLLEQLGKRTSERVDDSDGSPSPPPTPEERPLRPKRGHKRSAGKAFDGAELSPGSATLEMPSRMAANTGPLPNGANNPSTRKSSPPGPSAASSRPSKAGKTSRLQHAADGLPQNAWLLFCQETRPEFEREHAGEEGYEYHKELAKAWREMGHDGQKVWKERLEEKRETWDGGEGKKVVKKERERDRDREKEKEKDRTKGNETEKEQAKEKETDASRDGNREGASDKERDSKASEKDPEMEVDVEMEKMGPGPEEDKEPAKPAKPDETMKDEAKPDEPMPDAMKPDDDETKTTNDQQETEADKDTRMKIDDQEEAHDPRSVVTGFVAVNR
ncbi:MAG: hypothetical protein M1826_005101 [Phylliscum demangeonii]|nr:MAG: hypothetical protein M1826_005101 [Phylliscum demangeonii]